jgi:2-oxoglutarate ferredoxin oxidoreductase subunit delta
MGVRGKALLSRRAFPRRTHLDRKVGMYFPRIDSNKCKNHGECAKICPEDVFDVDSKGVQVARPGDCTKCEACVVVCPEQAIQVEEM